MIMGGRVGIVLFCIFDKKIQSDWGSQYFVVHSRYIYIYREILLCLQSTSFLVIFLSCMNPGCLGYIGDPTTPLYWDYI